MKIKELMVQENQKTDLSANGDEDLIDMFLNDEGLYSLARRASRFEELEEYAAMYFIYTQDQLNEFKQYFEAGHFE